MKKKIIVWILVVVILIVVTSGVSYWFLFRDKCQIDEKIKYSIYDYNRDNGEDGLFQTLGIKGNYKIVNNYEEYLKYEEFLTENVKFSKVKLYDKNFFLDNNLVLIDIYENMACNASFNVKKLFIENNTLILGSEYDFPKACGGGKGISALIEVPKDLKSVTLEFSQLENNTNFGHDVAKKPVMYLYPQEEMKVKVKFLHPERLTTTYPKYDKEWDVLAKPNGDLLVDGKYYYALYWESIYNKLDDFTEGFYVNKDNAITFLEEKLSLIGLNDRERNEFIMYWLPILENNEHNLVYFELTDEKEINDKLIIIPEPNSLLRVTMHVKKIDGYVEIKEQKLKGFEREGFVAVEWGGVRY